MDDFEWNTFNEYQLMLAVMDNKPVGVNKHFAMACISEQLQENNLDIPTDKIWAHLKTMYNLESLDELETTPFPNEEKEFYLPELEFGAMKVKKEEKIEEKTSGKSTPTKRNEIKESNKTPNIKEEKPVSKKDNQRRDSKDGKEAKLAVVLKKEIKKEVVEKPKPMKSRSSVSLKEEEKPRTPNRSQEEVKRMNKRPLRGSTKPEEPITPVTRKPQSPVTVTPTSVKRRRL